MSKHIVRAFDEELQTISAKLIEMGGMVEESLSAAMSAVKKREPEFVEEVEALDKKIEALDYEIEELATNVIALRQPMALDLRVLLAALKISTSLERMGSLCKNIARRGIQLQGSKKKTHVSRSLIAMGKMTSEHLTQILNALSDRDDEAALEVWNNDVEIDESYNALFRELVTYMSSDARLIGMGSQMLFIAKNLERLGDHCTHIADMIYYIVKGERLGDERPKGDPLGLEAEFDEDE